MYFSLLKQIYQREKAIKVPYELLEHLNELLDSDILE